MIYSLFFQLVTIRVYHDKSDRWLQLAHIDQITNPIKNLDAQGHCLSIPQEVPVIQPCSMILVNCPVWGPIKFGALNSFACKVAEILNAPNRLIIIANIY
jgi:hypothetical protein